MLVTLFIFYLEDSKDFYFGNVRMSIQQFDDTERRDVDTIDIIGRTQQVTFLTDKGLS